MTKPYSEQDLSDIFDADLIWRRKELSDMKAAIKLSDPAAKSALLRALIPMSYAHWEGYVRTCANRYFEFITLRRRPYNELERQIYVNTFVTRLGASQVGQLSLEARCNLINEILDSTDGQFRHLNPSLIDTRSNLSTDVIIDICKICAVDPSNFEDQRTFIDVLMLKRRNAIAHGQLEFIQLDEVDDFVENVLSLMTHFRGLLENKVYLRTYAA